MKVSVWDTYVKREDGKLMHFDILVSDTLNDEKAIYRESCRGPQQTLQRVVDQNQSEQKLKLNRLLSNLSDIQQEIRSAGIIALNAKVESAKSPEYQASLDVIADDILHSTNQIKERIDRSQSIIKMI